MKPHRQRKHDTTTRGGATPEETAIDHAVAPFDRAVREAERTWGVDRLPELVSPEMAAKWGMVVGLLNEAITGTDVGRAAAVVAGALRGLAAMEAEARSRGHTPPEPFVLETQQGDHHFGILHDGALWQRAQEQRPGLRLYTLTEVSVALQLLENRIAPVVDAFPGATVTAVRTRKPPLAQDPIPF